MFNDLILSSRVEPDEARELLDVLHSRGPVIGTDEAGRGALAGPVVAAAAYLTHDQEEILLANKLRDSKKLTPVGREKVFMLINKLGVKWRACSGSVELIESKNILMASLLTMRQSVMKLAKIIPCEPACVIIDGPERTPDMEFPQWPLVRADDLVPTVSAASIIAKVIRDRLMKNLDAIYPGYNFSRNKGYPTKAHIETVKIRGISNIHRASFCRKFIITKAKR